MPRRLSPILALCLLWPAAAAAEEARYSITISGLTAGTFTLAARSNASSYAVTSQAASAGLAGLVRSFTITSKVSGRITQGALRPQSYVSQSDGARAGRGAELEFQDGTPRVISLATDRNPDAPPVDPASLTGVVDPLTGLYAVLRDTNPDRVCQLDLTMFDGHRVSRVTLGDAQPTKDGTLCSGSYTRVAGYPAADLAERRRFDFTVLYSPTAADDQVLRARELAMDSLFGPARMTRN